MTPSKCLVPILFFVASLGCAVSPRSAQAGPLIDWLFGRSPAGPAYPVGQPVPVGNGYATGYAGYAAAPAASYGVANYGTPGNGYAAGYGSYAPNSGGYAGNYGTYYSSQLPTIGPAGAGYTAPMPSGITAATLPATTAPTLSYVPNYQTYSQRAPVTYYRPLMTTDPNTGAQVVAMAPALPMRLWLSGPPALAEQHCLAQVPRRSCKCLPKRYRRTRSPAAASRWPQMRLPLSPRPTQRAMQLATAAIPPTRLCSRPHPSPVLIPPHRLAKPSTTVHPVELAAAARAAVDLSRQPPQIRTYQAWLRPSRLPSRPPVLLQPLACPGPIPSPARLFLALGVDSRCRQTITSPPLPILVPSGHPDKSTRAISHRPCRAFRPQIIEKQAAARDRLCVASCAPPVPVNLPQAMLPAMPASKPSPVVVTSYRR